MSDSMTTLLDDARRITATDLYPVRCRSVITDLANALQSVSTDLTESREYALALEREIADRSKKQDAFTAMASSMDADFQAFCATRADLTPPAADYVAGLEAAKRMCFRARSSEGKTVGEPSLIEAIQALGAMPEGYCFCSKDRIGDDSKQHEPECRDLRAALDAAEARAVEVPDVVARGVVRDTSDPTGRTMYVLFDRAMSDDEMRDWHDGINALHPASPLGAVTLAEVNALVEAGVAKDPVGRYIDELVNMHRSGQLITLAERDAAVAKAVEAEREAIAAFVETHAYTSTNRGVSMEPSPMAKSDLHHGTIAAAIRARKGDAL